MCKNIKLSTVTETQPDNGQTDRDIDNVKKT